ncbi:MAG TPA: DoxX family protein [Gemmatimonadaceae bacterium]|nr:DoxX family protein [Gemmatimonadaceae bacterium]
MFLFHTPTRRQIDTALAVLRVVLGVTFILHGGQKLFVYGFDGVAGAFGQMGIPAAAIVGPFVALVEFFGGIAIVLGLLTRLAALGIGATMVVAILAVHLKQGFFNPGGIEFPLALLASSVALVLTGAGAYSADAAIAKRIATEPVVDAEQGTLVRKAA